MYNAQQHLVGVYPSNTFCHHFPVCSILEPLEILFPHMCENIGCSFSVLSSQLSASNVFFLLLEAPAFSATRQIWF